MERVPAGQQLSPFHLERKVVDSVESLLGRPVLLHVVQQDAERVGGRGGGRFVVVP